MVAQEKNDKYKNKTDRNNLCKQSSKKRNKKDEELTPLPPWKK